MSFVGVDHEVVLLEGLAHVDEVEVHVDGVDHGVVDVGTENIGVLNRKEDPTLVGFVLTESIEDVIMLAIFFLLFNESSI